jgi:hypothetical protein
MFGEEVEGRDIGQQQTDQEGRRDHGVLDRHTRLPARRIEDHQRDHRCGGAAMIGAVRSSVSDSSTTKNEAVSG